MVLHKTTLFYLAYFYFDQDETGRNVQGLRKAIVVELFLVFVTYTLFVFNFSLKKKGAKEG